MSNPENILSYEVANFTALSITFDVKPFFNF